MFRLGAHVSISGGFPQAVEREIGIGGNCGQLFVGSPRGWAVGSVDDEEARTFREVAEAHDISPWLVHGTYLINFATPKDDLGEKSVATVQAEIDAAAALGIPYYTFHPGAHTGAGVDAGIENVADRLSMLDIPDGVMVLLENTAGRGTTIGRHFDELNDMVQMSTQSYDDVGVCIDTCHLFSAGYDFRTDADLDALVQELDAMIGLGNVHFLHLNDSKHPFGSEKDEHEHIGDGAIGEEGFQRFINHDALRDVPMVLETPEDGKGYEWNIEKVKELRESA